MKLFIAFDDTDNLTSPGTGHILEDFRTLMGESHFGRSWRISRHQLFVHPDVPYTSHNSAMCFVMDTMPELVDTIAHQASLFLLERSSEGSDPGLCLMVPEQLSDRTRLIEFGWRAKREVLSKNEAYNTAKICGIRLSEHGGTGDGVIGALAGAALRLDGNDGRFRGQLDLLEEGQLVRFHDLIYHGDIDRIGILNPEEERAGIVYLENSELLVFLQDKPKTILMDGKSVLLLIRQGEDQPLINWSRDQLKRF